VTDLYRARFLVPIAGPPIEDGALAVRDGRILEVGPVVELKGNFPGAGVFDFCEAVLLPPLVNAHTHLELTDFPGWREEFGDLSATETFVDWIKQVVRIKKQVTDDRFRDSLAEGLRQSLAAGTGAIGDILSRPSIREIYQTVPLLGRVFFEILGVDPARVSLSVDALADLLEAGPLGGLYPGAGPHAPYSVSDALLNQVLCLVREKNAPLSIHLAETEDEVRFLKSSTGLLAAGLYPFAGLEKHLPAPRGIRPVPYFASLGGLGPNTLVVHGVHVVPSEAKLLAESGTIVVLCPRSNARLGAGRAPIEDYFAAGVPLALGTDSLASSDSLSVWDEIAFARDWFGSRVASERLLEMATRGGAGALGLRGEMGELTPGAGAHFQVLRPEAMPQAQNLIDFLCSPGRTEDVAELFLNGRRVWYN